ncbi:MAG: tail fiber domain-containing protein [Legionella sp.]|uniref:tail fiber domain-containing protein n=1 Tax=Legionella sp. TaxID=459 RepID=UPI00284260E3|nr:tail fiber domain-containing protein [Legionella sp.]
MTFNSNTDFSTKNGIVVNSNLIYAPGSGGQVGINTNTLNSTLTVNGTANISGNVALAQNLTVIGNTSVTGNLSASGFTYSTGGLGSFSFASITSQGAYLYWNKGGEGGTWLINQKGVGTGGVYLGESTTSNVVTQSAFFSPSSANINSNTTISGTLVVSSNATFSNVSTTGLSINSTLFANGNQIYTNTGTLYLNSNTTYGVDIGNGGGNTTVHNTLIANAIQSSNVVVTSGGFVNFAANAAIYSDTSGNGPGDITFKTYTGTTATYSYFANSGSLVVANNLSVVGGYVNDAGGNWHLILGNGSTTSYRGYGTGYQHAFYDFAGTNRWLIGASNTDHNIYSTGDIVANWSDQRLKENIIRVNTAEGLDRTLRYNVVSFEWNETGRSFNDKQLGIRERGLIAQEVQKINPDAVAYNYLTVDENGQPYLTIKEEKLIFDLISAVQEQQKQIKILQQKVSELENK